MSGPAAWSALHLGGGEGEDEIDGEVENEDGPDGEMRGSMEGEVKAYVYPIARNRSRQQTEFVLAN